MVETVVFFKCAIMRKPQSVFASCFFGTLFIFVIIQLYSATFPKQRKEIFPSPPSPIVPACEVWPGWRTKIPASTSADQVALSSSHIGTHEVMAGQSKQACTPAKERLGPFGHASSGNQINQQPWTSLRWGLLQSSCANKFFGNTDADPEMSRRKLRRSPEETNRQVTLPMADDRQIGRTAVVLRAWDAYEYSDNQLAWMRAIFTELSLDTGGRFQAFILVNVKDNTLNLFDDQVYSEVLQRSVPEEFHDAALLYNEAILRQWYPKVGEYGAQDQMYQALQIFSHSFPEFDFVWQLEMDVRFTANIAGMLTNAGSWARKQPRKNLWERNGRWFIPGLWNNYESFSANVDSEFDSDKGIWGPHPYAKFYLKPQGPKPPMMRNDFWGIGEEAELITLSPLIDPVSTRWTYETTVHGFQPASLNLPRRMAIISMTRTSRRLLRLVSTEQQASGSWVVSESTPETWSLLHGLKAVYVPHLVIFNLESHPQGTSNNSAQELDQMLHKGPPWNLAGGEHTGFLWCNDVGLPEQRWLNASYFYWQGDAPRLWREYTDGSCTHPLVLHPVKND